MVRGDKLKEFLKVLKMIDIYHIEKVSISKQKGKSNGKILFTKRNKKIKL